MEYIEGIIVAKSRKYRGYCLVIYCPDEKKFFRIISKDKSTDFALSEEDCTTESKEKIYPLNIVKIPVESKVPIQDQYQKENIILRRDSKIEILGDSGINDLIKLYKSNELHDSPYIFTNDKNVLSVEEGIKSKYSFILARVDDLTFNIDDNKCRCSFEYKEEQYKNIFVTVGKTKEDDLNTFYDGLSFESAFVGFSYGKPYSRTGTENEVCYKFFCSFLGIFDSKDENAQCFPILFNDQEINNYFNVMIEIQEEIIKFIENENISEDRNLIQFINSKNINEDKYLFKSFLYLISKISNNHQHTYDFYEKIDFLIQNYKETIKKYFTSIEIFNIFHKNKIILFKLIENKIIIVDQFISNKLRSIHSNGEQYNQYFFKETKPFLYENSQEIKIHKKRRNTYENDEIICSYIREDSDESFIEYVSENKIPFDMKIKISVYETNSFLIKNNPSLIEYACFFGAIKIFNYLKDNNVELKPELWFYSIHSNNLDMIDLLEKNKVDIPNESVNELIIESIKCHHNKLAEKFIQKNGNNKNYEDIVASCLHYYNFKYISKSYVFRSIFYYACKYDHYCIADFLIKKKFNTSSFFFNQVNLLF